MNARGTPSATLRTVAWGGVIGASLGALVAVLAHFLSDTLPSTYEVVGLEVNGTATQTLASPTVHPSWFPTLPVAIVVGVAIGCAAVLVADRLGYRIERRRR